MARSSGAFPRFGVIGIAWSFSNPLLVLLLYACVLSVVFKARRGFGVADGRSGFAILLFVGMIVYGQIDEVANRAPVRTRRRWQVLRDRRRDQGKTDMVAGPRMVTIRK